MGYAARVMRGLIIDYAAQSMRAQAGRQLSSSPRLRILSPNISWTTRASRTERRADELAKVDRGLAEVVDLRFFCGFSFAEIAAMRQTRSAPFSATGKKRASTCGKASADERSGSSCRFSSRKSDLGTETHFREGNHAIQAVSAPFSVLYFRRRHRAAALTAAAPCQTC
jgi:hypothetical protein